MRFQFELQLQPNALHRLLLNQTDSSGADDSSAFDTNMVVTLSVLLCLLLLLLGLNTLVRCGFCWSSSGEQTAVVGLKKRALRQLPVAFYGSGPDTCSQECAICLGEFVDGERIRVLPKCGHGFHAGCIDQWLISHASCPNCRLSLLQQPTDRAAGPHQQPPLTISTQIIS